MGGTEKCAMTLKEIKSNKESNTVMLSFYLFSKSVFSSTGTDSTGKAVGAYRIVL